MAEDTQDLAQDYKRLNGIQNEAGLFLLERLSVRPGEHVLDVGCGPGNLTAHIAEVVGEEGAVVGIDPSRERIALALADWGGTPPEGVKRGSLSFYEGRAEDLSRFGPASFDVLFVSSTFHWVQDKAAALREFARVLRPGGRLGISSPMGQFNTDHIRIKAEVLSREPFRNYPNEEKLKILPRSEIEALLDAAGFLKRDMVTTKMVLHARNTAELFKWAEASSAGNMYGGLPPHLIPRARGELMREWDKFMTEDGFDMQFEVLYTVAVK